MRFLRKIFKSRSQRAKDEALKIITTRMDSMAWLDNADTSGTYKFIFKAGERHIVGSMIISAWQVGENLYKLVVRDGNDQEHVTVTNFIQTYKWILGHHFLMFVKNNKEGRARMPVVLSGITDGDSGSTLMLWEELISAFEEEKDQSRAFAAVAKVVIRKVCEIFHGDTSVEPIAILMFYGPYNDAQRRI